MLFSAPEFVLGFLPVVIFLYVLVRRYLGRAATVRLLLAASIFFYGWWNPAYVLLLGGSIGFNWLVSRRLQRGYSYRSAVLAGGIVVNVALLGYFKYTNFLIENVNWLLGADWQLLQILLPLAISFYTFQQIAFLVDSYSHDTSQYNFQEYALFVAFFPQLIAGPIVHHTEMLTQFHRPEAFALRGMDLSVGLTAFSIGLFKKIVIADSLAAAADPVFAAADGGAAVPFAEAWIAALAFTLQVYFDFSGYSDMALGLARMFGIRLPLNFNSPYKARNIVDFWQRWHITLTRFLTDYIYSPLSLSWTRRAVLAGRGRSLLFAQAVVLPLFVVFLVSGIWHGAGWTFVVWGMIHFVGMAVVRGWQEAKLPALPYAVGWMLTMLLVVISLVFFRAGSIQAAVTIIDAMSGGASILVPAGLQERLPLLGQLADLPRFRIQFAEDGFFTDGYILSPTRGIFFIISGLAICLLLPNCAELLSRYRPVVDRRMSGFAAGLLGRAVAWRPSAGWSAAAAVLFSVALTSMLDIDEAREFIYFQF